MDPGRALHAASAPPPRVAVRLQGPAGSAGSYRMVTQDLEELRTDGATLVLAYDVAAVERALALRDLAHQPDWVVGVRMLLGEMGPWRLARSEQALAEAVGILATVRNRLDPERTNPDGRAHVRAWPGCGPGGTFVSCANPSQYLGLKQRRALRPLAGIPDEALRRAALDVAVLAWWALDAGATADPSDGAVRFEHRCGGAAYGLAMSRCDGDPEVPDVEGGAARVGPVVFRGPGAWDASGGRYRLVERARVDHVPGEPRPLGAWLAADETTADAAE